MLTRLRTTTTVRGGPGTPRNIGVLPLQRASTKTRSIPENGHRFERRTQMSKIALVTGATSGIGRAFADRLASDGHDLIAVGRDDVCLGELATAYPEVAVRTIASDLSTARGVESVISSRGDVPIDLLINNAGLAHRGSLANRLPRQVSEVLGVKAIAPVMLTHAV